MRELYYDLEIPVMPLKDMTLHATSYITNVQQSNINDKIVSKFRDAGMIFNGGLSFYTMPFTNPAHCHKDGKPHTLYTDWPSMVKLNYVIGKADTRWYDTLPEVRKKIGVSVTPVGTLYQSIPISSCTELCSIVLQSWHLFESGVPHAIFNLTSMPRWCISIPIRCAKSLNPISMNDAKKRISGIKF